MMTYIIVLYTHNDTFSNAIFSAKIYSATSVLLTVKWITLTAI